MMNNKKTIMHITGTMNFGGAEVLMMNIIRKLHDKFNFIFLINMPKGKRIKGDFDEEILSLGAQIIYCDSIRSIGLRAYEKKLERLLIDWNPDVVHCHLNAKCGVISKCAYRAGIKKIISHSHAQLKFKGNPFKSALSYAELYWQRSMINKYSTDFWGCSKEALCSLFNKKVRGTENCKIISNLIDAKRFIYPKEEIVKKYKQEYNPKNKFAMGVIGRIAPVKNYLFALEVAKELKNRSKEFILFIVGLQQDLDYTQKLFSAINAYNLKDVVVYIQPKNDIENIYGIMNVVLGTSLREGFSLTAVEAQLSGAYTFLSNGYPQEVNLGAGNCERIESFDVNLWSDKIEGVMKNMVYVEEDIRKQTLIHRGFDLDVEIEKIAKEYEK